MPFDIDEFTANLDSGNLAKLALFDVLIARPGATTTQTSDTQVPSTNAQTEMMLRCEATTLPGRLIKVSGEEIYHYGLDPKRGWSSSFQDVTLTFILGEDYAEKIFFEEWQDLIVGPYRKGDESTSKYDIGYFDDYKGTVTITCYSEDGSPTYECKLLEAIPVGVGDLNMNWASTDIAKLTVTFTYIYYEDKIL